MSEYGNCHGLPAELISAIRQGCRPSNHVSGLPQITSVACLDLVAYSTTASCSFSADSSTAVYLDLAIDIHAEFCSPTVIVISAIRLDRTVLSLVAWSIVASIAPPLFSPDHTYHQAL